MQQICALLDGPLGSSDMYPVVVTMAIPDEDQWRRAFATAPPAQMTSPCLNGVNYDSQPSSRQWGRSFCRARVSEANDTTCSDGL